MINNHLIQLGCDSFWQILLPGLAVTLPLTLISFSLAFLIALFVALVQVAHVQGLKQIAQFYVWLFRGTPLLVQLYVIFYGLPKMGIVLDAFFCAVVIFAFNTGAYVSETIRASIMAIPKGQLEAGYCVGLSYQQTMFRIILPQALKNAFPPLSNSLIGLVKDTSLAANITIMEMFMSAQRIAARTYEPFLLYCEVALIYLLFCTVLTQIQKVWLKKLQLKGG